MSKNHCYKVLLEVLQVDLILLLSLYQLKATHPRVVYVLVILPSECDALTAGTMSKQLFNVNLAIVHFLLVCVWAGGHYALTISRMQFTSVLIANTTVVLGRRYSGINYCCTAETVLHLSLIHISEPTRPY